MSNVVFAHHLPAEFKMNSAYTVKKNGRTIALQLLSQSEVSMIIDQMMKRSTPLSFRMKIGIANVHPKDRYERSVGRRVSVEKMQDVGVAVHKVIFNDKEIKIKMECAELDVRFTVKKYKDSGKIRMFVAKPLDFVDCDEVEW